MIFRETELPGAYQIDIERKEDARGFFARAWCCDEFARRGLTADFVQGSISVNRVAGTLRGLHFQRSPLGETKLVRCSRGAIFDVIVDLRPRSRTFRRWTSVELTAESYRSLYVPDGFAHGFQTLEDDSEVSYQITAFHDPGAAAGIRYDDPSLGVEWPRPVTRISPADRSWPNLEECRYA